MVVRVKAYNLALVMSTENFHLVTVDVSVYYYNSSDLMFFISEPGQFRIDVYYLTLLKFVTP